MNQQSSPPANRRPWDCLLGTPGRRRATAVLGLAALLALLLGFERVRGQRQLAALKRAMAQRQLATDIREMAPRIRPSDLAFHQELAAIAKDLDSTLLHGGGQLVELAPGQAARGSQAPALVTGTNSPILTNGFARLEATGTQSWTLLAERVTQARPAFTELQSLLQSPPATRGLDPVSAERGETLPNFFPIRLAAQGLNDTIVLALHEGNLAAATDGLVALAGIARYNAADPTLIGQMIRVAVVGIGHAALWDALHAKGWTEPQLKRIQTAWQLPPLLPDVVRSLHFERLSKLERYSQFRAGSYREWEAHYRRILTGFGANPAPLPPAVLAWRHHVFHPLWQFAWADQEMALYLRRTEFMSLEPLAALARRRFAGSDQIWLNQAGLPTPPAASWRFYLEMPLADRMHAIIGPNTLPPNTLPVPLWAHLIALMQSPAPDFNLPDYSRTLLTATRNEMGREMAVTSVALQRHVLRHGRLPADLAALVPEFLPAVPTDWWSGQNLRYQADSQGGYLLYALGPDGQDDRGKPMPPQTFNSPGHDQVWPQEVAWENQAVSPNPVPPRP